MMGTSTATAAAGVAASAGARTDGGAIGARYVSTGRYAVMAFLKKVKRAMMVTYLREMVVRPSVISRFVVMVWSMPPPVKLVTKVN
mgnify:CR=1 FL=1